ncbi:MAG: hypothetical protein M9927_23945 [Anaerolineae bacterium]|nr:hypothetical protein [Anaerolineae bacterium]
MLSRSADSMISSLMIDRWPSNVAVADFGVSEQNIGAYQRAIRNGSLTADALHEHVYDSKWLTEAIGAPVNTGLDFLLAFEDDDNFEEDDDEDDEDYYDDEDFDPEAAYYKFMNEEYPAPGPNTITFQLGATKYTLTKNDEEEFPDFSQMNEEQIRAWCFR